MGTGTAIGTDTATGTAMATAMGTGTEGRPRRLAVDLPPAQPRRAPTRSTPRWRPAPRASARSRSAWWSLLVTGAAAGRRRAVTGSVALLADTIHNFSDALTAIPLWIAFVLGRRAATRRYTYGYGRAEDLAGVFIVAMIALSAVVAGYESIRRLINPEPITHIGVLIAAGLIGFVGNELVAVYRIRVGRRIGSAALVADGLHARTDGFTSLAVVAGALGVLAGFPLADPLVGLVITVAILVVLRSAARDIYRRLMDAVDPELVDTAEAALRDTPGVHDVESLRLRWIGHRTARRDRHRRRPPPRRRRRPRHRRRRPPPAPAPGATPVRSDRARQPGRQPRATTTTPPWPTTADRARGTGGARRG